MHKPFHHIFTKWPLAAILVFRFSPKSIGFFHSRSSMAVSYMNLTRALVSQLREAQALACGGGCRGGGSVQTKTIISPKFVCRCFTCTCGSSSEPTSSSSSSGYKDSEDNQNGLGQNGMSCHKSLLITLTLCEPLLPSRQLDGSTR